MFSRSSITAAMLPRSRRAMTIGTVTLIVIIMITGVIIGRRTRREVRSEETQIFQQFSTPIPLGLAALTAASLTPADRVLEPSAGTGLLAILAEITGSDLILNELAATRADLRDDFMRLRVCPQLYDYQPSPL